MDDQDKVKVQPRRRPAGDSPVTGAVGEDQPAGPINESNPLQSSTSSLPLDHSFGGILNRPRPTTGTSSFFGSRPVIPTRTSSASFSRRDSGSPGHPLSGPAYPSSIRAQEAIRSASVHTPQNQHFLHLQTRSASASEGSPVAPRKVVRPDNWWHNGKDTQAPSVPVKSPLREFFSDLPPLPSYRTTPIFARTSNLEDLTEQEALRLELSPPPLRISKRSSSTPTPPSLPQKTLAPLESQALLEPPNELPYLAREEVVKKVVTEDNITEATKPDLAEKVEEAEDSYKRKHRKMTLEILEGSPAHPEYKKFAEIKPTCRPERKPSTLKMDSLHPESAAAMTAHRREAIRLAKTQERAVAERCKRSNQEAPGYTFDELIGKGSFGRVYRGRQLASSKTVAIKVLDIDDADFQAYGEQKDEQIKDFNREIRILRQAQDSGAENLNQMIEALPVHSQLWMICEYCPGGSVKTLMRATNDRLAEQYIVIVARELGKALKGLHEAGIIHRDIKAANVLIHEEGRLELCDFGVANVLDNRTDKRRTFIGTLHWMPPELWTEQPEYSDEVDVWGYGCTLYECALGRPPNSDLRERQQLKMRMRRLKQAIALPENEIFSDSLRSLVKYALSPEVATRPTMKNILEHEYLANTEETHPTSALAELVKNYYGWLFSGGQRISLFMPGGAAAAATEDPDSEITPMDEWRFSMTPDFERRVSAVLEIPDLSDLAATDLEGEETPKQSKVTNLSPPRTMTAAQKANFEARVNRGAADLSNLFDQSRPAYEFKTKTDFVPTPEPRRTSDLPFRAMAEDRPSSIASNVIDLGDFDEEDYAIAAPRTDDKIQTTYADTPMREQTFRLADASTLRQKRADSKGPREPNQSLTAKRASSADDAAGRDTGTASYDFAAAQQDWTVKDRGKAPELQDAAEITSASRPGHATMDWSFASAMAGATPTSPPQAEPVSAPLPADEPGRDEPSFTSATAKSRATLDWSFTDALNELNTSSSAGIQHSPPSSRTPKRPAPLQRQMTMPVTQTDFQSAREEMEVMPRPSTALSEAYSESSASSADVDPFGLEQGDSYPGPATLDESGISNFYASRGRTMLPDHVMPRSHLEGQYTAAGAPYPYGRPPRIGEQGYPGPASRDIPSGARLSRSSERTAHKKGSSSGSGVGSASNSSGRDASSRQVIEVPDIQPPSVRALSGSAGSDEVVGELERLLEGMQGMLGVAGGVVGGLAVRGPGTKSAEGAAGGGSGVEGPGTVSGTGEEGSEWEDEE